MPPLLALLPVIAGIDGLAATGIGLGETLSNQPGKAPATATPTGPTAAQQTATINAEKAAVSQQAPNVISDTSGLANPDYIKSITQLLAGTAGTTGSNGAATQAINSAFGLPGGGSPGTQNTSTSNFTPAGVNPNPNAAAQPVQLSDFVNSFLT